MTNTEPINALRSWDEQRREFAYRRFLAMPLAGAVAWTTIGVAGAFLKPALEVWVLFGATGCILYLGMLFSRFTGENCLDKQRPKNVFDERSPPHRRLVGPGFRDRHPFLSARLHLVAVVGRHLKWFDVAAPLLDPRTLDRNIPHPGADCPGDGELVFVSAFAFRYSAGCDRRRLRGDYH